MTRKMKVSRRSFLRKAGAAAALVAAPTILSARNPNEKLNIAIIGAGGRGRANTKGVASENIVALCDVDQTAVDAAAMQYPKARKFTDFRKVFDHANEFDAVVVSTCEHTHAFATLPALTLGKHVYCEKPLTHNIGEARVIRQAAARAKVATQMGTQNHATDNYRRVVELVQIGAIGPVREVHVWVSRAWGLQSVEEAKKFEDHGAFQGQMVGLTDRPKESVKPPSTLDWELWLGPAPYRPFHPVYVPGPKWYRWWDFGSGTMSDLGSHWNDLPFWALNLKAPVTIDPFEPKAHPELAPASMQVTYEFPARPDAQPLGPQRLKTPMPALRMTWYQGVNKPQIWKEKKIPQWANGVLFIGDHGMLLSDYGKYTLLPEEKFKGLRRMEPFIPKSLGHYAEWIHACKTGEPTTCNFDYAGWLTEANHLGNVAYRAGMKIEWDADSMSAKNCPDADRFIRREYRKGWKLV